jgi:hypothetical protein
LAAAPAAFSEACAFDQKGVAAQLQRMAKRNPGNARAVSLEPF